jgi:hypothetical protein
MLEALNQLALVALANSFETMAFLSPAPLEELRDPPPDVVRVSIFFTGNSSGIVEMVAPRSLGRLMASNMLVADSPSLRDSEDALKELLNVLGGLMIRRWMSESRDIVEMSLPKLRNFSAEREWSEYIRSPFVTMLDVEGNMVVLRVSDYPNQRGLL